MRTFLKFKASLILVLKKEFSPAKVSFVNSEEG
jgi:hypothetical protein